MDNHHNAYTEKSFDATVHSRRVELPAERVGEWEEHTTLVLNIRTHPDKDNGGIPRDVVTLNLGLEQARRVYDALAFWVT